MEVLSCLLQRAIDDGYISGVKERGRGGEVEEESRMLFVDDMLVSS